MGIGKPKQSEAQSRVRRSGERLIRLAYELERLTERLRAAGYENDAINVKNLSRLADNIGRDLDKKVRP